MLRIAKISRVFFSSVVVVIVVRAQGFNYAHYFFIFFRIEHIYIIFDKITATKALAHTLNRERFLR